jgi:hypothetical protein
MASYRSIVWDLANVERLIVSMSSASDAGDEGIIVQPVVTGERKSAG